MLLFCVGAHHKLVASLPAASGPRPADKAMAALPTMDGDFGMHAVAMTKLTNPQRQLLQQVLEHRQTQLQRELQTMKDEKAAHAEHADDMPREPDANQSTDRADQEVRHAEKRRDELELQAVKAALQRLQENSYGECVDCGKAIALPRLQATPSAARCIECQSKAEAKP